MRENFDFFTLWSVKRKFFINAHGKMHVFQLNRFGHEILTQKSEVYINSRNQGQYSLVSGLKYSYFFVWQHVSQLMRASLLPYYSLRNVYFCFNTFDFVLFFQLFGVLFYFFYCFLWDYQIHCYPFLFWFVFTLSRFRRPYGEQLELIVLLLSIK